MQVFQAVAVSACPRKISAIVNPIPFPRVNPALHEWSQKGQWPEIASRVRDGLSPNVLATPDLTVFEEFLRQVGTATLPPAVNEDAVFSTLMAGLGSTNPARPTPLALVCVVGRPKWVMTLLEKGHDPNERGEGHTPLTALASQGLVHPLRLENLTDQPEYGWDRMERSLAQGTCAEVLIDAGADIHAPSSSGATALMLACLAKNTHLATTLLCRGASPHPQPECAHPVFSMPPLEIAILSHNETVFRFLVDTGANPFAYQSVKKSRRLTLVDVAAGWGSPGMLEHLADRLGSDNEALIQAWWVALEAGNRPTIDWYLRKGINGNHCAADGSHPSHVLARAGHFDLLSDFFRRGLRLDVPDAMGNSALDVLAVYHPHLHRKVKTEWRGLPGNVVQGRFSGVESNQAPE